MAPERGLPKAEHGVPRSAVRRCVRRFAAMWLCATDTPPIAKISPFAYSWRIGELAAAAKALPVL